MGRPASSFHRFIGQRRVVDFVGRLIHGAKTAGDPCSSMMLIAPAGAGKTSMGQAIADDYGTILHVILAGSDTKAVDLCRVLREVKHGDVVLIDEGHSLSTDAQQLLYLALDQWKIPTLTERGIDRSKFESIAQFTLVVATNEPGHVKPALRSRLTRIEFDPYTQKELRAIADRIAQSLDLAISPQAAGLLAATCQGSPRLIKRRIGNLCHYWSEVKSLTKDHVRGLLDAEGVDEHGFTPQQREYLKHLATTPGGQSNVERLAIRLGCDTANVRQEVEPYLIEQGLVDPASRIGRTVTPKGMKVVASMIAPEQGLEDIDHDDDSGR